MFAQPPTTVGWTEVEELRAAAIRLKRTDMRDGAGLALRQADERVEQAERVLAANCRPTSRPNLVGERAIAAAWVFNNAAFMHHDLGEHQEAFELWYLALEAMKQANSWSMYGRILGQRGRQHLAIGNPTAAVADLTQAIEGDRHGELTATEMAMLHALRGRAYGAIGDEQSALAEIGIADSFMYAKSSPDDSVDREWFSHYDDAHHNGDTGAALRSLVHHGHRHANAAIGLYEHSLGTTADGNERSRVLVCGSLARLHLTEGEVERGFTLGHDMLTLVERNGVMSRRVVDRIQRVYNALDPAKKEFATPEAGHLREHTVDTLRSIGL